MPQTTLSKPYNVQPPLSEAAKKALHREQAYRQLKGIKVRIRDIAAEWIEERAKMVP